MHDDPSTGHGELHKTLNKAYREVFWNGLKRDVIDYVSSCPICQFNKFKQGHPVGLLQPLPVPSNIWTQLSLDFIEKLPNSQGYSVIWVIVDILFKYAHFICLQHPYTAEKLAQKFMENVYKLHGLPKSSVQQGSYFLVNFGFIFSS